MHEEQRRDSKSVASWGSCYRNVEKIGKGGSGCVYKAERVEDGKVVALKVLKREERVSEEIAVASQVSHPCILCYVSEHKLLKDQQVRTVLEGPYFEGKPLWGHESGILARLSLDQKLSVAADVAGALAELHRKGIFHRDVKLENILVSLSLDGVLECRLIDYGVVKLPQTRGLTNETDFLGTERTSSPRALVSSAQYSAADDVYSLAVTLLEMIIGHPWCDGLPTMDKHAFMGTKPIVQILPQYYPDVVVPRWLMELLRAMTQEGGPVSKVPDMVLVEEALRYGRKSDWWVNTLEARFPFETAERELWKRRKIKVVCTGCDLEYVVQGERLMRIIRSHSMEWDDLRIGSAFPIECTGRGCRIAEEDRDQDYTFFTSYVYRPGKVVAREE